MTLNVVTRSPSRESNAPASRDGQARRRAVFLDKDGTLLEDVPYNVDPRLMRLAPGAADALRLLATLDFELIVISNQSGVALGRFAESALADVEARLAEMFAECGARLGGFHYCPHAPRPDGRVACTCRKPMPGLIQRATVEHRLRLDGSWMIGDILDDVEAGRRAGCRTILLANGNETVWQLGQYRSPHYLVHGLDDAARVVAENLRLSHVLSEPVSA